MANEDDLFLTALAHDHKGDVSAAIEGYLKALCVSPDHADAAHNLAIIEFSVDIFERGLELFGRALICAPRALLFRLSYGRALSLLRQQTKVAEFVAESVASGYFSITEIEKLNSEIIAAAETGEVEAVVASLASGNSLEVIAQCARLSSEYPENPILWKCLGSAFHQTGNLQSALKAFDKSVKCAPLEWEARADRGATRVANGQFPLGLDDFLSALCLEPASAPLFCNIQNGRQSYGSQSIDIDGFRRAWFIAPDSKEFLEPFAVELLVSDRVTEADLLLRRLLCIDPSNTKALLSLGLIARSIDGDLAAVSRVERAAVISPTDYQGIGLLASILSDLATGKAGYVRPYTLFQRAIILNPSDVELSNNFSILLQRMELAKEALYYLDRCRIISPEYADSLNSRGIIFQAEGNIGAALLAYQRATVMRPSFFQAISNLGSALWRIGRMSEAVVCFQRAMNVSPAYETAAHNRCKVLHGMLRLDEAIAGYEDLERRFPLSRDIQNIRWHHALARLAIGDFDLGWRLFEARWLSEKNTKLGRKGPENTLWKGERLAAGQYLLVESEQGYGDILHFFRYSRVLVDRGTPVITRVPQSLLRLLRGQSDVGAIIGMNDPVMVDYRHCPMMSLPLRLGTTLSSIPYSRKPYLVALSTDRVKWKNKFETTLRDRAKGGGRRLRVGLVWSGGFRLDEASAWEANQRRNIPLDIFASALDIEGIDFVSLQKGDPAESEVRGREGMYWRVGRLLNVADDIEDFADTAGIIANLDLVISVDTSTAHLSAAMGKPTWILSRYDACWRWMVDRADSPWYPSVRLYRQSNDRNWYPVMRRVANDLRARRFDE